MFAVAGTIPVPYLSAMKAQQQTIGAHAQWLALNGRLGDAHALLNTECNNGDPEALFTLACWRMGGDLIGRDLTEARRLFGEAAIRGHIRARQISTCFLAHGTGGTRDWPGAMHALRERASTEPLAAMEMDVALAMDLTKTGEPKHIPSPQQISETPNIILFPNLFSTRECSFLKEIANPVMQPAVTVDPQTGRQLLNPVRTSDHAGFPLMYESPVIHALNRRIAAASATQVSQGEPLQILRYRIGQQYRPHSDALPASDNQRVLTMLVYLNKDYDGGETHFLSNGLAIRGNVGDGLLFRNVRQDGTPDPAATHAGLPVTRGIKFIASRWIREKPLSLERPAS